MKRARHITELTTFVDYLPYLINGDRDTITDQEQENLDEIMKEALHFDEEDGGHKSVIVSYDEDKKWFGHDDISGMQGQVIDLELIQLVDTEPTGSHTVSNTVGYLVEIYKAGDAARLLIPQDKAGDEHWIVTEWLEIGYIEDQDEPEGDLKAVIDPEGWNVPMELVSEFRN